MDFVEPEPATDPLDTALTLRLTRERAMVGAALLDPACADLLLAEVEPRDLICSVAESVLKALAEVRDDDPVAYATDPTVELVAARAGRCVQELGGRVAVEALVADRPALREASAALRAAVATMAPVEEEPLVKLAKAELGATEQRVNACGR
jgi:hypothetical protein